MRTIKESILGSNNVGIEETINQWYNHLHFLDKDLFKKSDDGLHYIYMGSKLIVDKKFSDNYPDWVVFNNPMKVVIIKDFDPNSLKRIYGLTTEDLYIINYNKPSLDTTLPYCKNMHVDNCYNMTSIKSDSFLETLEITKCPKITSLKAVPSSAASIVLDDCDGITNLDGAEEKCKGSISIIGCKSLISLNGCPEKVNGNLIIKDNINFTNIESFPKLVTGTVLVRNNGRDFTEDEIKGKCKTRKVIVK